MQVLDIADMYVGLQPGDHVYRLSSMVCYYGCHYVAYILRPDSTWDVYSDSCISRVGSWRHVVQACVDGRHQPSLVFFQKRSAC